MLQHPEKYLYIPYITDGGLDSNLWDLERIVNAALFMRRVPIIKEAVTPKSHRLDNIRKSAVINWDKYIDLSKTEILRTESSGVSEEIPDTLQYIYERDFDFNLYSKRQVRFISREQVHDKQNDQYPIICLLKNEDLSSLKKPVDSLNKLKFNSSVKIYYASSFFITFPPSKEVNDLTEIVLGYFGTTLAKINILSNMLHNFSPRYRKQRNKFLGNIGSYACMCGV